MGNVPFWPKTVMCDYDCGIHHTTMKNWWPQWNIILSQIWDFHYKTHSTYEKRPPPHKTYFHKKCPIFHHIIRARSFQSTQNGILGFDTTLCCERYSQTGENRHKQNDWNPPIKMNQLALPRLWPPNIFLTGSLYHMCGPVRAAIQVEVVFQNHQTHKRHHTQFFLDKSERWEAPIVPYRLI